MPPTAPCRASCTATPDRALLTLLHVCPVYCRFCFRRERVGPGAEAVLPPDAVEAALAYIADHPAIWEVILTGGDPLALSPRRIAAVMARLGAIDHVRVVRFHTRVPVVAPETVTPELVAALAGAGKTTYVGLHCNHPRELTPAARAACGRLIDAGLALVSQTVLLRGVNDDADTLAQLMRRFVELRIRPYYLHHGDLAPGTGPPAGAAGRGAGADAGAARAGVGPVPADLRARHPGRARQGAGRPRLHRGRHRHGSLGPATRLRRVRRTPSPAGPHRALSVPGRWRP